MANKTISELNTATLSDSLVMVVEGATATEKTTVASLKEYIQEGVSIDADSALSVTSENPVQNKVITTALNNKVDSSSLASVATSGAYSDLTGTPTIPAAQIQSDWNQTDDSALDYIKNKPNISEGVIVDQAYDPVSTNAQSGVAVSEAVSTALSSTYRPAGSVSFANLGQLVVANEGKVYNVNESFTTTIDFVDGLGATYPAGTNVVIINVGTTASPEYKYDVLSGFVDLSAYATTASLATVATSGSYDDLSNKPAIPAEVTESTVSGWGFTKNEGTVVSVNNVTPVNGNVALNIPAAQVQADWNETDSTSMAYIANKPSGFNVDQTYNPISANAQSGVAIAGAGFLTQHQDISGKQDVSNLVTSLSASSTDTQYPSAKCVYDMIGDIEAVLATI